MSRAARLEARRPRGTTQADLARAVKSSRSRVAKMEAGDPAVPLDLLVRTLFLPISPTGHPARSFRKRGMPATSCSSAMDP